MSLPNITSIKKRALSICTTTTSAAVTTQVSVPFRAKYLYSNFNFQNFASQTAAWTVSMSINGSTANTDTFITNPVVSSSTTSTAAVAGGFNTSTSNIATLFLNEGDTIATFGSSVVPYSVVHILQEF